MANELLESIGDDIRKMDEQIKQAEELIGAMKEVGEDTTTAVTQIKALKIKKQKWTEMLSKRGIQVGK